MKAKKIYSGNTLNGELTITEKFNYCNAVFIIPSGLNQNEGYEIASSLVIELTITENFGGIPITTKYGEKEININLNFFDTGEIVLIPDEAVKQGFNCKLIFATTYPVYIDVYAVEFKEVSNDELSKKLDRLQELTKEIITNSNHELVKDIIISIGVNALTGGALLPLLPSALKVLPSVSQLLLPGL